MKTRHKVSATALAISSFLILTPTLGKAAPSCADVFGSSANEKRRSKTPPSAPTIKSVAPRPDMGASFAYEQEVGCYKIVEREGVRCFITSSPLCTGYLAPSRLPPCTDQMLESK